VTASKATASVIAAKLVIVVLWLLSTIHGWSTIPDVPREAIEWLVTAGIAWAIVYYAPANKHTTDQAPTV
jgi:hypothetical protein